MRAYAAAVFLWIFLSTLSMASPTIFHGEDSKSADFGMRRRQQTANFDRFPSSAAATRGSRSSSSSSSGGGGGGFHRPRREKGKSSSDSKYSPTPSRMPSFLPTDSIVPSSVPSSSSAPSIAIPSTYPPSPTPSYEQFYLLEYPTPSPIRTPTPSPTQPQITSMPSSIPSPMPSPMPSPASLPSALPSLSPQITHTSTPRYNSHKPSSYPTKQTTITTAPTQMPHAQEFTAESDAQGAISSPQSSHPTPIPTPSPQPPLATRTRTFFVSATMDLDGIPTFPLQDTALGLWEAVASEHLFIRVSRSSLNDGFDLGGLFVRAELQGQGLISNNGRSLHTPLTQSSQQQTRALQNSNDDLLSTAGNIIRLFFDLTIVFRSPFDSSTDDSLLAELLKGYVSSAFDDPSDRDDLSNSLQNTVVDDFNSVTVITVSIGDGRIRDDDQMDDDNNNAITADLSSNPPGGASTKTWLIVGSVLGGLCTMLLLALLLYVRNAYKRDLNQTRHKPMDDTNGAIDNPIVEQQLPNEDLHTRGEPIVQTFVNVTLGDDVSTLGDPTLGSQPIDGDTRSSLDGSFALSRDNDPPRSNDDKSKPNELTSPSLPTASRKQSDSSQRDPPKRDNSGSTVPSKGTAGGSGAVAASSESLLTDDDSFERQYDEYAEKEIFVIAPPGKLEFTVDTIGEGVPTVFAILDSSILYDQIFVGDKLVSVDGTDTTTMTAVEVSKFLSERSSQPKRQLGLRRMVRR